MRNDLFTIYDGTGQNEDVKINGENVLEPRWKIRDSQLSGQQFLETCMGLGKIRNVKV